MKFKIGDKNFELVEEKPQTVLVTNDDLITVAALHFNEGKLPVELVPVEAIEAIAHRLQLGIKKGYPANNWKKGLNYTELLGSIFRHLYAFQKGEKIDIDDKTGIEQPHLWGAICCLAFLAYYETYPEKYGKFDDLGDK